MNHLLLDALNCENRKRPPVWLMRQAGRYMPSYQAIRSKTPLWEMFHNQEIIEQVTMLPVNEIGVDAAIVFSDILLPLECLNFSVHYPQAGGPYIEPYFTAQSSSLHESMTPANEVMPYLYRAMKNLSSDLKVPLIGFSGAPFTTATYAIEEKGKHANLTLTKKMMVQTPDVLHHFLSNLSDVICDHLMCQVQAGAKVLQIFDSWAGLLSKQDFLTFALPYIEKIINRIKAYDVPVIVFSRGSSVFASDIAKIKPNAISLDWTLPVFDVRKQVGTNIALQGNFDPTILFGEINTIEKRVKDLLREMEGDRGFIVNLGHGVLPGTNQDHVRAFVDAVKN